MMTGTAQQDTAVNSTADRRSAVASEMLRGRDIVCFCHDWNSDPLSKTHLMRLLARDNRILWVNSIGARAPVASGADARRIIQKLRAAAEPVREVEPGLFVLSPLSVPVYGQPLLRRLNQLLLRAQILQAMRRLRFARPVNYIFLPTAGILAGQLNEDLVIYQCVDEYTAFTGIAAQSLLEIEEHLLRRADLVIVSAERLYESKSRLNPRTVLVRHGVDHAHFRQALLPETIVPEAIARLPRPVLGFFGLIADWVDLELLEQTARHFSHGSLVMLGKVTTDITRLASLPNVNFVGRVPYSTLPAYCRGFDVALMPFRINELTLNANPLKVREYLAAGLPVVSTAIPEVEATNLCRIGESPAAFIREIENALLHPGPDVARSEQVRHESWEARLEEIRHHLSQIRR